MPIIGCDTFRFMSKCINLIFNDDFHNFLQKKLFIIYLLNPNSIMKKVYLPRILLNTNVTIPKLKKSILSRMI